MMFVRFFGTLARAQQFMSGEIFLGQLAGCRSPTLAGNGRRDVHEGAFASLPAGNVLVPPGFEGECEASDTPIVMHCLDTLQSHVLCVAKVTTGGKLHDKWSPERYGVLTHYEDFHERFLAACKLLSYTCRHGSVLYWDHHTDELNAEDTRGFHKRAEYQWQDEYRYLVDTDGREGPDGFLLRVGDLSKCTLLLTNREIQEQA